jgi:heat shock protein 5
MFMLGSSSDSNLTTGNRITPSYVAFSDGERLVGWSLLLHPFMILGKILVSSRANGVIGDAAKNQYASNPKNTIFDIKSVTLPPPFHWP